MRRFEASRLRSVALQSTRGLRVVSAREGVALEAAGYFPHSGRRTSFTPMFQAAAFLSSAALRRWRCLTRRPSASRRRCGGRCGHNFFWASIILLARTTGRVTTRTPGGATAPATRCRSLRAAPCRAVLRALRGLTRPRRVAPPVPARPPRLPGPVRRVARHGERHGAAGVVRPDHAGAGGSASQQRAPREASIRPPDGRGRALPVAPRGH